MNNKKNKNTHEEYSNQLLNETIECVREVHNKYIEEFSSLLKFKDINNIYSGVKIILVNINGREEEPKILSGDPEDIKYVSDLKNVVLSFNELDQPKKKHKLENPVLHEFDKPYDFTPAKDSEKTFVSPDLFKNNKDLIN